MTRITLRVHLLVLLAGGAVLGGGCVSLRQQPTSASSHAFDRPETTALGRLFAADATLHRGRSGFRLLEYGREALVARTALADAAEATIDAQYYICAPDATGSLFFQRLIAAADRGVRVRLLLDDNNLSDDREMAALCAHPNIEVRVFNPFRFRMRWARLPQYAIDFDRLVRRMHNKTFIVDNQAAIVGGRNIGDDYFSLDEINNFHDIDLLMIGPLAREASRAFDKYWNSRWAVPATRLMRNPPARDEFDAFRAQIESRVHAVQEASHESSRRRGYLDELTQPGALIWADGEVISEPPRKIERATRETSRVFWRLVEELRETQREAVAEVAYFIPTRRLRAEFDSLRQRGVEVKLMTAALEATDVSLVFAAYKKHRRNLLLSGVELYEYKAQAGLTRSERKWHRPRSALSSLHTKVLVFDRQRVWVGSANLDPRSVHLNTEIAVLVNSEKLAARMMSYLSEDFSPRRSWHVQLESRWEYRPTRDIWRKIDVLTWTGEQDGRVRTFHREPAAGMWQRTKAFLYTLIPGIEAQL